MTGGDQTSTTWLLLVLLALCGGILLGLYIGYRVFAGRSNTVKRDDAGPDRLFDQVVPNHLLVTNKDHHTGWFLNLTQSELERLRVMAAALAKGRELTGAIWAGHGKLWSRAEFESLVDGFLQRGWAIWNSPHAHNQGLSITQTGLDAFRFLAGMRPIHAPSPTGKVFQSKNAGPVAYAHTCTQQG